MATFYCLVGLPYSGKSTYALKLAAEIEASGEHAAIHSSDAIREEIFGDASYQGNHGLVFETMDDRAFCDLGNGESVIYDATSLGINARKAIVRKFRNAADRMVCIFMATPYEMLLERQKHRDRVVPLDALKKMYTKRLWIPNTYEGWDEVRFVYPEGFQRKDYGSLIDSLCEMSHDNPHHTVSVGQHCINAMEYVKARNASDEVQLAALLHDIGKPFTKSFVNTRGETTKIAHFYGHEHVSAYDALFYIPEEADAEHITALIQWHMAPYSKGKPAKFEGCYGDLCAIPDRTLFREVMLLHNADLMAG